MDAGTLKTITDLGTVGVCLFVIWLGWKREERTAIAFEKLNERNQAVHEKTIENLASLNANAQALHAEVRARPCVSDDEWNGRDRRHSEKRV